MQLRVIILGLMLSQAAYGQTFTEKISRELAFEKKSPVNALIIANVNGSVTVTGNSGDKVVVEVNRFIYGKTDARLEKGKQEVELGIVDLADTLILYVRDGCMRFERNRRQERSRDGWGYQSQPDCQQTYDYKMDFTVKIPLTINLDVSTINDGDVSIENVDGAVRANNINGSVRLTNIRRGAEAHTINGDVDIVYARNPDGSCRFYTLNGDINALFQPGLSANMSFESFNGDLFTNLDRLEKAPSEIVKEAHGEGVSYKIDGNRYRIGNGGALLEFETFNGNVYIKEKK
jgi:DUF4097 and DUF4098 domain-containing protein YvlB